MAARQVQIGGEIYAADDSDAEVSSFDGDAIGDDLPESGDCSESRKRMKWS